MARGTREKIMRTANRLFYSEGINLVGVDRIVAEAKIAKTTLYAHFRSKEALIEAYIEARHERAMAAIDACVAAAGPDPIKQLTALFDQLQETAASPDFRGCSFLMAVAECAALEEVRRIAAEHNRAVQSVFDAIVARIPGTPEVLGQELMLIYIGALARAGVERDPMIVACAARCAMFLLSPHTIDDETATRRSPLRA